MTSVEDDRETQRKIFADDNIMDVIVYYTDKSLIRKRLALMVKEKITVKPM